MSVANRFSRYNSAVTISTANNATPLSPPVSLNSFNSLNLSPHSSLSPPPVTNNIYSPSSSEKYQSTNPYQNTTFLPQTSSSIYVGECAHSRSVHKNPEDYDYTFQSEADISISADSTVSAKPEFFKYEPVIAKNDTYNNAELQEENFQRSWEDVCESVLKRAQENRDAISMGVTNHYEDDDYDDSSHHHDPSSTKKSIRRPNNPRVFHFGFPKAATVAPRIQYAEFYFALPPEIKTHQHWKDMVENQGCILLQMSKDAIQSCYGNQENLIGNPSVLYHWKVYHIRILEEYNQLPLEWNVQISTALPIEEQQQLQQQYRQQWIPVSGPNMFGQGGGNLSQFNYVTVEGIKRTSLQEQKTLYKPNEDVINSVGANRWLDVSEVAMKQLLAGWLMNNEYVIPAPNKDQYIADNPVQFVLIDEFQRIVDLCIKHEKKLPTIVSMSGDSERKKISVDSIIFDHVFFQKFRKYNKQQLLMRMDDLHLTLTPIKQDKDQWKIEYETSVGKMGTVTGLPSGKAPRYQMKLEIAYEDYTGNEAYRKTAHMANINSTNNSSNNFYYPPQAQHHPNIIIDTMPMIRTTNINNNTSSVYSNSWGQMKR